MKRDLVTLVWVEEVRERAGVYLEEKPNNNSQRIDTKVSSTHCLPLHVSLVTSKGLSRLEVALDEDGDSACDLSKVAGLHPRPCGR